MFVAYYFLKEEVEGHPGQAVAYCTEGYGAGSVSCRKKLNGMHYDEGVTNVAH